MRAQVYDSTAIVNTDFPEFPVPVLVFPIIPYTGGAGTMHGQHFSARLCAPPYCSADTPSTFGTKFRRVW